MPNEPKIALLRSSNKPFEQRIPIHPEHFQMIEPGTRKNLWIQKGYSADFGYPDDYYQNLGCPILDRNELLSSADCSILVRGTPEDLKLMREKSASLAWFHCVQNQDVTNAAINKKLTLFCMESLYDENNRYFFEENSRITGKQAMLHALKITNLNTALDAKIVIIGHGNAGISAIYQLLKLGFNNITCCSKRKPSEIKNKIDGIYYEHIMPNETSKDVIISNGAPLLTILKDADIIINATTQDIRFPLILLKTHELQYLKDGALIIDISCDKKMTFEFSHITSLSNPIIKLGKAFYYAIDHVPTLDFDNASKEISFQLIKILSDLIQCLRSPKNCSVILDRATQIKSGVIINQDIDYFQKYFT